MLGRRTTRWPRSSCGRSFRDFAALTPEGARDEVARLDVEHGWRRGTVWAELDQAPLAFALEQLVALGELTQQPLVVQ